MTIVEPSVDLVSADPLENIERAGRASHRSAMGGDAKAFCERMLNLGHHSVLEFGSAHVVWVCDRGVSHEIVRHRLASFCQESTRYVDYSDDLPVIVPPGLDAMTGAAWETGVVSAETCYRRMVGNGATLEQARALLPTCTATTVHIKCNYREWSHIIKARSSRHAHPQIRELAKETARVLDHALGVGWFSSQSEGWAC